MTTGTVFNIQRYSIHDGPGIRTTVFIDSHAFTGLGIDKTISVDFGKTKLLQ